MLLIILFNNKKGLQGELGNKQMKRREEKRKEKKRTGLTDLLESPMCGSDSHDSVSEC